MATWAANVLSGAPFLSICFFTCMWCCCQSYISSTAHAMVPCCSQTRDQVTGVNKAPNLAL